MKTLKPLVERSNKEITRKFVYGWLQIFILIGMSFICHEINGQTICEPSGAGCIDPETPVILNGYEGISFSYVFPTTGTVSSISSPLSEGLSSSSRLELFLDMGSVGIRAIGSDLPVKGSYPFTLNVENSIGDVTDYQKYELIINRKPVDVVIVLDKSGSMGSLSGSSSISRWDALKSSVDLFMTDLEPLSITGDRIGLTFFDGAVVSPPGGPVAMIDMIGSKATIMSNLTGTGALSPGGLTAMGSGLQDAFGKLPSDPTRTRIIVVFTDGLQNVPPMVSVISNEVYIGASTIVPSIDTDPLKIYPIGIGTVTSLPAILNEITTSDQGSGGMQIHTEDGSGTSMSGNYGSEFLNMLAEILSGGSPQIIDTKAGIFDIKVDSALTNIVGYESKQSFIVNKGVSKLLFNVISNALKGFSIVSVKKDGAEMFPDFGKLTNGNGFRTYVLDFKDKKLLGKSSSGTWTIQARSALKDPYVMTLIADDHNINYRNSSGNNRLEVGKPIQLVSNLNYSGRAIKNATINAIILRPGDDLGNLLSTTPSNSNPPSSGEPSNPGVQKYDELIKNPDFLNKLLAKNQIINLVYNSADSSYSGQFLNTDVSGVYQVIFRITTPTDPNFGELVRYQKNSIYVYFPDIDVKNSAVDLTTNSNTTVINFRPIASNKKFIGPGWGSMIKFDSKTANVQNVVDNGDGSYSVTIQGNPESIGKFSLGGYVFFEGKLSSLGSNPINPIPPCGCTGLELPIVLLGGLIISIRAKKRKKML